MRERAAFAGCATAGDESPLSTPARHQARAPPVILATRGSFAATLRGAQTVTTFVPTEIREVRERFLREGYVANRVGHRGAVGVDDDDVTPDGAAFLVMELLEGETLDRRRLRHGGRLPPQAHPLRLHAVCSP